MLRKLLCVGVLSPALVGAETGASCGAETAKISQLEAKVTSLQTELEQLKAQCSEGQRLSLTKFGSQCVSLSNDVVQHVLGSTDLDERIAHHVSNTANAARKGAASFKENVVDKVSSVNYTEHYHAIKSSEAFQTLMKKTEVVQPLVEKARPLLAKARESCQPVIEKAEPVLAKAKDICQPVVEKAMATCASALTAVQDSVMPAFQNGGAKVFDSTLGAGSHLDRIVAPVFDKAATIAPQHLHTLPHHPVDRVLFIIAFVVFAYYSLYLLLFALRFTLKFLKRTTLASFFVFRLFVLTPLRLAKKIISTMFWMATGFYCCGLCARKKSAAPKNGKAKKAAVPTISAQELEKVLNSQKKGEQREKAAKLFADHAKSGKPLDEKFKQFKGKVVTKDVLAHACKKLGLKVN